MPNQSLTHAYEKLPLSHQDFVQSSVCYQEALALANTLEYKEFTPLQEIAFLQRQTFEENLFVVGATSSGKTLIPLLLFYLNLLGARKKNAATPKMLFVVPYRALAAQKTAELRCFFKKEDLRIIQSTGEYRQDDGAVQSGDVDIGVIITEKVYKFASRDSEFLARYDYLVLDEIGLIDNIERGIRLDFILAWAKNQWNCSGRPKIIALGTPFYNWSEYIENYEFFPIQDDQRPIKLVDIPTIYSKKGIERTTKNNPCLRRTRLMTRERYEKQEKLYGEVAFFCPDREGLCPAKCEFRHNLRKICPDARTPCSNPFGFFPSGMTVRVYALLEICRYHLQKGHQLLIFVNDREEVKKLCGQLYTNLRDILPPQEDPARFRELLLRRCCLDPEDIYGILETEDMEDDFLYYRALSSGIGFHSAALPNELRTYIEQELLENRKLKIVCSTETLAFGINSSVETVVIADLRKSDGSESRLLTLNEYHNYAGRAGRYSRYTQNKSSVGYVYTLVRNGKEESYFAELRKTEKTPQRLYSRLYERDCQVIPFILLNLLLSGKSAAMSEDELYQAAFSLPKPANFSSEDFALDFQDAVRFMKEQSLIIKVGVPSYLRGKEGVGDGQSYALTRLGHCLRGYIISVDDYLLLYESLNETYNGFFGDLNMELFLFRLLSSSYLEAEVNGTYFKNETKWTTAQIQNFYRKRFSQKGTENWLDSLSSANSRTRRILYILAALLHWMDGESAKALYRNFGIHFALLSKVAQQIGYLLEIAQSMTPAMFEFLWHRQQEKYERFGLSVEDVLDRLPEKEHQMRELFCSVYYGLNIQIWRELLAFLERQPDAGDLTVRLSIDNIGPELARLLRRICVRYRFFTRPSMEKVEDVEIRNNYGNQRWQYCRDIQEMGPLFVRFFEQRFHLTIL